MPRTITTQKEVYTARELQKLFPAAFEKVCDRKDWREALRVSLVPHFGQKYAKKIANR